MLFRSLGQVLRTDSGFVIVDFEGEPARPLAERRARECALKDVAGMLRSFVYAARAAMLRAVDVAGGDSGLADLLVPWATGWEDAVRSAFLEGYLAETQERGAAFLPRRREVLDAVLRVFELDKIVYEVGYEINHRPNWVRIPLEALLQTAAPAPRLAPAHLRFGEGPFSFVACLELREFVGARAEDERQLAISSSRRRSTRSTITPTPSSSATSSSPASTPTTSPRGWPCISATRCSASGSPWSTPPSSTTSRRCATSC